MRRARALAALVVLVATCGGDASRADPRRSVVAIEATGCRPFSANAVGTVIGDGLVVTVAHAVAGEDEVTVRTADGSVLSAVVASIDTGLDAAVLRLDELDVEPVDVGSYDDGGVDLLGVEDGAVVSRTVAVRRPVTIRTTDIYRRGEHLRDGLEVAVGIRSGDSGGGLVDGDGRLVGMVWAASRRADDRTWAITAESFDGLIAAAAARQPVPAVKCSR